MIPLRWCPLVIELQLHPIFNSWHAGENTAKWTLSDISLLADVVHLDINLDNLLQERHRTDKLPLNMKEILIMNP